MVFKRVVIDADPGVDDALALILALRSPEIKVEAITTVHGNVPLDQAAQNVFTLLEILDHRAPPVVGRGASRPLRKPPVTSQEIHGWDGLGGLDRFKNPDGTPRYPVKEAPSNLPDATAMLLDLLGHYPEDLTLIALGPLTNLASALRADRARVKRLREVVIMGGAIDVPGNITPAAEFNIFVDPHAAQQVFASGLPIKLVPLDVTKKVVIGKAEVHNLAQRMGGPLGRFLVDCTSKIMEFIEQRQGVAAMHLHDPLAVGVAIDPSLVKTTQLSVDVETDGRLTQGMTVADLRTVRDEFKASPNLHAALEVDAERFMALFKERLCG
jgi:purine nucleosidase/pyrimidine-specific ribonucleoside hydrolase